MRYVLRWAVLAIVLGVAAGPVLGADKKPDASKPQATAPAKKEEPSKAKPAAKAAEKKPPKEKTKADVVEFTLRGEYPEAPTSGGLFGDLQTSLRTIVERLDSAATDTDVKGVLLRIDPRLEIGRGKVFELREAVARVRKTHKPVVALLGSAEPTHYLIASACDRIYMVPSGMLLLPGVRAEMAFYKGLMDKIGVEFDVLQQGKYKGAGEPFTRTNMSPALRESIDAVVDDSYQRLSQTIAADRKMEDYRVKTLIDQGLFTASAAREAGLVDHLLYADQLEDRLAQDLKVDKVKLLTTYKKKRVDTDFSGLGGMMKLMEMMFGGKSSETTSDQKKIALVYAVGPITEGKSTPDMFGSSVVGSTNLCAALRKAADDATVKAVVLRIDSPGGSAVASDLIWREVVRMHKPVIASMGDVAGSGGYYIAMGAKKIIATPDTITGSIGVIGGKMVLGKLLAKIGVSTDVVCRGKNCGSMSSLTPFSESERKAWTRMLEETYNQFVGKAAQGRKMPFKDLEKLAQGRIYTGRMAQGLRLVDAVGSLQDAIVEAKKAAGLKPDEKVEVMVLPQPRSFLEALFGDQAVSGEVESLAPGLAPMLRQVLELRQILAEPVLMLMPMRIELK
jgi:protease-4